MKHRSEGAHSQALDLAHAIEPPESDEKKHVMSQYKSTIYAENKQKDS